jgi:uncharacterized repeat protein (TIGR01451 family)
MSFCAPVLAEQAGPVSLAHFEPLQRLSVEAQAIDGDRKLVGAGPVAMKFDALGRSFDLELAPNSRLLKAVGGSTAGGATPYRGQIAGNPDSWVRITMIDGTPTGLIWDGSELLAVERPDNNLAGSESPIVYRLADAVSAAGSMTCGGGKPITTASAAYEELVSELNVSKSLAAGAVSEINMGAIGDFEFFSRYGAASRDQIIARLNNVDGIFSREVNVQITVPPGSVEIFEDSNDPFTAVNAGDLLDELALYRRDNAIQNANGLTHLWTGKNVISDSGSASTVGIAFNGTLCSRQFGAALSEGRDSATFDSLIAAHEIGHNFGAPHDAVSGACQSAPPTFLMATTINGNDEFSQCSKDQMADNIAQAERDGCITPLPVVDMRVNLDEPDPTVLLGNVASLTFDVANAGAQQATNVEVDFSLPSNISLLSVASTVGNCDAGAGSANCIIGTVAGSSTVSVTLTSDTTGVGAGRVDAIVGADADENLSNNTDSVLLTVQPAVNLSITAPAARRIDVNASTSVAFTLENIATLDAAGVALDVSVSSGLQLNSVSWAGGSCALAGNRIDCRAATFEAQSMSTLTVNVTGTTTGTGTINASVSSLEADANPANNSASATVNVGSAEESGGGGSLDYWLSFLLSLSVLLRLHSQSSPIGTGPREPLIAGRAR